MTQSVAVSGTDFIRFYNDSAIWDEEVTSHDHFTISVNGQPYDLTADGDLDVVDGLTDTDKVIILNGYILNSVLDEEGSVDAVEALNDWIIENATPFVTRDMTHLSVGMARKWLTKLQENIEQGGSVEQSLKLINRISKMLTQCQDSLNVAQPTPAELNRMSDRIVKGQSGNAIITNYFMVDKYVIAEVFDKLEAEYEYWSFVKDSKHHDMTIHRSIEAAMIEAIASGNDEEDAVMYAMRVLGFNE